MHGSIYGETESGKTYTAALLAKRVQRRGMPVAVYDPMSWNGKSEDFSFADFVTDNKGDFIDYYYSNIGHFCVVDECGTRFGLKDSPMTARGRHWGHCFLALSQKQQQMNKTLRDQCNAYGLVFLQDPDDSKALSKTFNWQEVMYAASLDERECFAVTRKFRKKVRADKKSGHDMLDKMADLIVKTAPEPKRELMKAVGIGGKINRDLLLEHNFLYEGYRD
jgi:hypothetical protein